MTPLPEGRLYLVATPIGHLEDITLRALRVLKEVHLIAAEDTRHTGKLLHHYGITTPQVSYHQHNWRQRLGELLQRLQAGEQIALVSDAGTPGISDPGQELVQACLAQGIPVTPVPGCNAAITALVASGLPTTPFLFLGFLPPRETARRQVLQRVKAVAATLICYEAPHRLVASLTTMTEVLGDRRCVVARELTKVHEEFWRGTLSAAARHYVEHPPKGEITLVVAGAEPNPDIPLAQVQSEVERLVAQGLGCREIAQQLAAQTGWPRRTLYQLALQCHRQGS